MSVVFAGYRVQGEHYTKKALYYRDGNQWQQVIKEINKGYSPFYTVDQSSIPLKFYSGISKYKLEKYAEAEKDFLIAKIQSPYNKHVLNNLGSTYYNLGKYDKAVQSYLELLKYYPNDHVVKTNIVVSYIKDGEMDKALELLTK